ncbi:MAG: hypothetical protein HY323_04745 [Betaproteobacteria bacterium]|nr:hypothetical protein [Betaproteobacteria bacterium]
MRHAGELLTVPGAAARYLRRRAAGLARRDLLLAIIVIALVAVVAPLAWRDTGEVIEVVQQDVAPAIEALERFRGDAGAYPDSLKALVPKYLAALPNCPTQEGAPLGYLRFKDTTGYELTCPGLRSGKFRYQSQTGRWEAVP